MINTAGSQSAACRRYDLSVSTLSDAIAAVAAAREICDARCLDVWGALQIVAPELTSEMRAIGFDELAAARWVCQPNRSGDVPAALVAAGRGDEVLAAVRRASHGFSA